MTPGDGWRAHLFLPHVQKLLGRRAVVSQRWDMAWFLACSSWQLKDIYPLVMTNISIENGIFIVDLPIKNGDFL